MTINIPNQQSKKWSQPNNSDLFGNLYVTKNITFDHEGYLQLSASPRCIMNETITASFDNSAAIIWNEDYGYFDATWDAAFAINESPLSAYPTLITTDGVPATDIQSGVAWFGGLMVVSQDNDVKYYNPVANTWTDTNIILTATSQSQHQVVNFLSLSALAIADVNTVKLYASPMSATPILITTLTINSDFFITGMCYLNQNLYIATMNRYGGHAFLYIWNGLGTAAQQTYEVDANMIFDVCVHRNTVVMLVSNGELMQYTGSGLSQLAAFPTFYENQNLTDYANIRMYHNMIKSNGDLLYINFSNDQNYTQKLLNCPDGIWCYDERVGLYHRYSNSIALMDIKTITAANVSVATDIFTTTAVPPTGTEVIYHTIWDKATPLTDNTKYYVIKVSSTEMKIATTKANAIAGTAIDITAAGNVDHIFNCFPNIDYGSTFANRAFAMCVIEIPTEYPQYGVDLMWGRAMTGRDNSASLENLIIPSPTLHSRGYFITPKIFSTETIDIFNNIVFKFSKFTDESDKIIIKYRNTDDRRDVINTSTWRATWTSSTTFTSTEVDLASAIVGDEIEFLKGAAGGLLAHIIVISVPVAGVYTVTIDEAYDNYVDGDKSTFVFRNWKKWKTITYGDSTANKTFLEEQLGKSGKFIQFKIELRGIGVRIEELLVDNIYRLPAKNK